MWNVFLEGVRGTVASVKYARDRYGRMEGLGKAVGGHGKVR